MYQAKPKTYQPQQAIDSFFGKITAEQQEMKRQQVREAAGIAIAQAKIAKEFAPLIEEMSKDNLYLEQKIKDLEGRLTRALKYEVVVKQTGDTLALTAAMADDAATNKFLNSHDFDFLTGEMKDLLRRQIRFARKRSETEGGFHRTLVDAQHAAATDLKARCGLFALGIPVIALDLGLYGTQGGYSGAYSTNKVNTSVNGDNENDDGDS